MELVKVFPPAIEDPSLIIEYSFKHVLEEGTASRVLLDKGPDDFDVDLILGDGDVGDQKCLVVCRISTLEWCHLFGMKGVKFALTALWLLLFITFFT